MKSKLFYSGLLVLVALLFATVAYTQDDMSYGMNEEAGAFVEVNGVSIYYEVYGEGEPILLLHGNGESIAVFASQIPVLAEQFQVIAVDTRAHGQSTDVEDEPFSYELFASDMVGLLDSLEIESAHVVGFSDGGNTGISMAINYPDRIDKLVAIGSNFAPDNSAIYDFPLDFVKGLVEDPELPPVVVKMLTLLIEHPNFAIEDLNNIETPALIVAGDHDLIREEHTIQLYLNIPNAYLFIIPRVSHFLLEERADLLNAQIIEFLTLPYEDVNRFEAFGG